MIATYLLWAMLWGVCAAGIYAIARDAYDHWRRDRIIRRRLRNVRRHQ